ncbi:uncharacterized protein LOC131155933 [Malania oleifera]|uniref:uncharacterized protein LOC131155933 n=1 Tax=Malania oleifera TaxID=397392 RepID=UPI0025AE8A05|nr:uncharacterized protein LOC131155933 [Malania oleifera]
MPKAFSQQAKGDGGAAHSSTAESQRRKKEKPTHSFHAASIPAKPLSRSPSPSDSLPSPDLPSLHLSLPSISLKRTSPPLAASSCCNSGESPSCSLSPAAPHLSPVAHSRRLRPPAEKRSSRSILQPPRHSQIQSGGPLCPCSSDEPAIPVTFSSKAEQPSAQLQPLLPLHLPSNLISPFTATSSPQQLEADQPGSSATPAPRPPSSILLSSTHAALLLPSGNPPLWFYFYFYCQDNEGNKNTDEEEAENEEGEEGEEEEEEEEAKNEEEEEEEEEGSQQSRGKGIAVNSDTDFET